MNVVVILILRLYLGLKQYKKKKKIYAVMKHRKILPIIQDEISDFDCLTWLSISLAPKLMFVRNRLIVSSSSDGCLALTISVNLFFRLE